MSSTEPENPSPEPQPMPSVESETRARPPRNDRLFLRALPFFAYHGVYEEERRLGQRFVVDADWWLDTRPAAWADKTDLTVPYHEVYEHIRTVVEGDPVNLIETLAERIASRLMDHFPLIDQVRIAVHKPGAPISGVFGDVGVEITRQR